MPAATSFQYFCGGWNFFPAMLAAIRDARRSVELEIYIFAHDRSGHDLLQALADAARQGVRVRVLADAYGSFMLPANFFAPLIAAGGEVRNFNPLRFGRFGVRDHRKLLVCDARTVFIGGANIADEYNGDGVTQGWFDLMLRIEDADLAAELILEFQRLYLAADFKRRPLPRLRVFRRLNPARANQTRVLAVKPGRGAGVFQRALQRDLAHTRAVDFIVPYFLPARRLRKQLRRIARRGGRVRLILPALCDVPAARAAAQVYYPRLLRAGVEIYEYQPQILHAKLYRVDEIVYAGSSNLDLRSFKLNYELMLRLTDPGVVAGAREIFSEALKHSVRIELPAFRRAQTFWSRWKSRWAHFLLARIDPLIALRQLDSIPVRKLKPKP
jgi:cardiolipin synthase